MIRSSQAFGGCLKPAPDESWLCYWSEIKRSCGIGKRSEGVVVMERDQKEPRGMIRSSQAFEGCLKPAPDESWLWYWKEIRRSCGTGARSKGALRNDPFLTSF